MGGEPPLHVLLRYARTISTSEREEFLEALIDDEMALQERMPADPVYVSLKEMRAPSSTRKNRAKQKRPTSLRRTR
ncbi:MAG: hypothetical protein ACREBG_19385 [Pyrinomonadaceae bacterium]